ncbi:MAG: hypothetical protein ABSH28_19755 [Acidobacteriota bacterium]
MGLQREFTQNMVFELGYVGSKGTRLVRQYDINQAYPGVTGTVQSRRPFTQYGSIMLTSSTGNSTYHALVARLERRFSGGLSFLASYTYGHSIDDGSGLSAGLNQDARNLAADRGNSNFDARHRLVVSYIYNLPFGRGMHFLKTMPSPLNFVLGGWQLSGISTLQSGRPIFVTLGTDISKTSTNRDRPNVVSGLDPLIEGSTSKTVFLNKTAFASPAAGTFGNAPRNYFNGPGTNNFDITLGKNFKTEKFGIQFRAEFFNAFNHPWLGQPVASWTNGAFGTITSTLGSNRQIQFGLKITY